MLISPFSFILVPPPPPHRHFPIPLLSDMVKVMTMPPVAQSLLPTPTIPRNTFEFQIFSPLFAQKRWSPSCFFCIEAFERLRSSPFFLSPEQAPVAADPPVRKPLRFDGCRYYYSLYGCPAPRSRRPLFLPPRPPDESELVEGFSPHDESPLFTGDRVSNLGHRRADRCFGGPPNVFFPPLTV